MIPNNNNKNSRDSAKRQNFAGKQNQQNKDAKQDRRMNQLQSQLNATKSLLNIERRKNTTLSYDQASMKLAMKPNEAYSLARQFGPSLDKRMINLSQDSSLMEKIFRTRFDPAHAYNYSRGARSNARTYNRSMKATIKINTTSNQGCYFLGIPSLEVPWIVSKDSGVTWKGRWSDQSGTNWNILNVLAAEAIKCTGKSFTAKNVTPQTTKVDLCYSFRLDPCVQYPNECNSKYMGTGVATNVDITYINGAAADAVSVNRKVIQNIPQAVDAISDIWKEHISGVYKVANIVDDEMRQIRQQSDFAGLGSNAWPPTNVTENGALRLGFLGAIAPDGSAYVTNDNAWNPGLGDTVRLISSRFLNTDIIGFYIPPSVNPQEFTFDTYEHYQIQTGDMDKVSAPGMEEPYDYPEYEMMMRSMTNELVGDYPPEYNSWGTVWNWIKGKASSVGKFYKDNKKLLDPALGLIPGASTALQLVDKYI